VAFVPGGASGIGAGLAAKLAEAGAEVWSPIVRSARRSVFEGRGAYELQGVPGEWRLFAVASA
jgi:NAD(P)-dependent dehydrogenase (short-subunit alcohol dehydrogenase family)